MALTWDPNAPPGQASVLQGETGGHHLLPPPLLTVSLAAMLHQCQGPAHQLGWDWHLPKNVLSL